MVGRVNGTVTAFDEHTGLGEVTIDDGAVLPLHCTAVADGSRAIEVGTAVTLEVVPGRRGRWEAARVSRR